MSEDDRTDFEDTDNHFSQSLQHVMKLLCCQLQYLIAQYSCKFVSYVRLGLSRMSRLITWMGGRLISYLLQALALKSDGYDAADLKALIDRAVHATVKRKIMHGQQVRSGNACL